MNKREFLINIMMMLLGLYIFLGYAFNIYRSGLIACCFIMIIIYVVCKKNSVLKCSFNNILWLFTVFIMGLSIIYSFDKITSINYFLLYVSVILIKILIENINNWKQYLLKSLLIFSSVHVIASLLYLIFPVLVNNICEIILSPENYQNNLLLKQYEANVGICIENGFNAFCITVFINLMFCYTILEKNKKRKLQYCMFVFIGMICLLTTRKRGLFISNIVSIILIVSIFQKSFFKRIIQIAILGVMLVIIMGMVPATKTMFDKFITYSEQGDVLNGREMLYEKMFNNIKDNFLIGSGIRTTLKLTGGNDGHNTYIQVFSELGLVGFILFTFVFIHSGYLTLCEIKKCLKNKDTDMIKYLCISLYYQIFFIVYGMSGNPLYNMAIFLLYVLMISLSKNIKETETLVNENSNTNIS